MANEPTEYLWSTKAEYDRHIDNLRNVGLLLEDTESRMHTLDSLYEFPIGAKPDEFIKVLAETKESIAKAIVIGETNTKAFHSALMTKENH